MVAGQEELIRERRNIGLVIAEYVCVVDNRKQ